ncbi:CopL family metal-binding regulatory protein [Lysobacter sp. HX-5-24]|uniref:CopL family metal-binding regulatory protein n=1 Tax=Noviluteimonas gilva TaxID=2682097 RepID=A0A7C9LI54_9GAMM|nr:CopL family metal-binding regulatory protein [Lysobacter gilvus]
MRAILLRLLLCIALVANGTSAVYASTLMASGAGMVTTSDVTQSADQPCPDMQSMTHAAMTADHDAPMSSTPPSHDDCCPPGACLCSCVSHVPTILSVQSFATQSGASPAPVAALRVSFASRALPNLIRPPIG